MINETNVEQAKVNFVSFPEGRNSARLTASNPIFSN